MNGLMVGASLSESHIDGTSAARVCHILLSIVHQRGPGGPNSSRAAARRRPRLWMSSCAAAQAGR